ncbi:MAG: hypothetical protein AAGG46_05610, partial [Planctomycetota bacterium]
PTRQQSRSNRLASAPEMFGDFLFASEAVLVDVGTAQTTGVFPIGGLGMKIGDNNSPLPRDRVFYRLNYFNNAIRTTQVINNAATFLNSASLAQHTVGFEKTLFDGLASVELRSAFANRVDIVDSNPFDISTADLELSAGGEGNLFVVTKFLLLETDSAAWSAGLGIEAPTGRDAFLATGSATGPNRLLSVAIQNETVRLHPYLAKVSAPNRWWFSTIFLELDLPVSDNTIIFDGVDGTTEAFALQPPTLLNIDLSAGYWFFKDRRRATLTGLAGIVELHSSTTLSDGDTIAEDRDNASDQVNFVGSGSFTSDGFGIVNLTVGTHLQLGRQNHLRIGGVFPISEDRPFENEVTVQWNRWF